EGNRSGGGHRRATRCGVPQRLGRGARKYATALAAHRVWRLRQGCRAPLAVTSRTGQPAFYEGRPRRETARGIKSLARPVAPLGRSWFPCAAHESGLGGRFDSAPVPCISTPFLPKEIAMSIKACPVTREEFRHQAEAVEVAINGAPMRAEVKEFATGSLGWF